MKILIVILQLFFCVVLGAATYYVAPSGGSDAYAGTILQPWATWQYAFETAVAGDTVYFRGGTWLPTDYAYGNAVTIIVPSYTHDLWTSPPYYGNNGTVNSRIYFLNYPGEVPILDCSTLDTIGHDFGAGISIYGGEYLVFKGLTVCNLYQPQAGNLVVGVSMSACYNIKIENMVVHDIGGRGIFYDGWGGDTAVPDYDTLWYINNDVYDCYDPCSAEPGNGADGIKMWNFQQNNRAYVRGNRVWDCSDDGFDLGGSCYIEISNNWTWGNGFEGAMDGNGIKFGGVVDTVTGTRRLVYGNLSYYNEGDGGAGLFDLQYQTYRRTNSRVYNNTIYKCNMGIVISENTRYPTFSGSIYRNNLIYGTTSVDAGVRPHNLDVFDVYTESNNTWDFADSTVIGSLPWWIPTDTVTVSDADFVSLDSTQLYTVRKADGSLPDITFLKLKDGSDLIDAGIQVPGSDAADLILDYYGIAPDIGYLETDLGEFGTSNGKFIIDQSGKPLKYYP